MGTALLACLCAVGACAPFTGPGGEPEVYVLASINGTPVDPSLNLWEVTGPEYAAAGAVMLMLGDTIFLHPGGRGEERNHIRSRNAGYVNTPPGSPLVPSSHHHTFSYIEVGRLILTSYAASGTFGHATYRRVPGDALELGSVEQVWRFERVRSRAAE